MSVSYSLSQMCWFQVICFLLPFLHFHSSALLLHSISSLISITLLLKSLHAASNGFMSDVISLSVSLGQTAFCSKLYSALQSFETTTGSIKYTQDAYCTNQKETDGPLNMIYSIPCYSGLHKDGQSIHKLCSLCKFMWHYFIGAISVYIMF